MNLLKNYSAVRLLPVSLIGAVFIIYPNIACLPWELSFMDGQAKEAHLFFFAFRYAFFALLAWALVRFNLREMEAAPLKRRFGYNFLITAGTWLLYVGVSRLCCTKADCFTGVLLFQFFVVGVVCTFVGHLSLMYTVQRKKEQEIEQLKIENLQSRCNALLNQINPHFFFNSLNSLTALIRKKDDEKTLVYVDKLSDAFRYILQSDKKGLVPLGEELEFVRAFKYMMEVRFAGKLAFNIDVDAAGKNLKIPVLSLLPLIDNIVVHNTIDSQHRMDVTIRLDAKAELIVSNFVYPKLAPAETNGTGLKNLENRFALLTGRQVRIENDGRVFSVHLPLK